MDVSCTDTERPDFCERNLAERMIGQRGDEPYFMPEPCQRGEHIHFSAADAHFE